MKKIITTVIALALCLATLFSFAGCGGGQKYVAKAIEGIEVEEYGFCVGKGASNKDAILNAMNEVISEANIDEVVAYYTSVSKDETPTVTLQFANLDDNTGGTLQVYTCSGFEPYEFVKNNEVVGVDIYLMELVAEKLNMKINVNDVGFNTICGTVAVEDNAIGAAGITITADRAETVAFSDAYYSSVQYIISKEDQAYTSLEALAGKKIGVQKGTTGYLMVKDAIDNGVLKDTGTTLIDYATGAVAFTAMKNGKCDFVVIDELPAKKLVGAN